MKIWANAWSRNFKIVDFETDLNQTTSQKKKAKFLSKNDAHLFGCQLWWFCFVWTNFPLQFQTSWEHFNWSCCVATFNSHLSSRVDVLNTNWTSMLCLLSMHSAFSRLTFITSFPKNTRERFSFCDVEELLNENARLEASVFQKSSCLHFLPSTLSSACARVSRAQ